MSDETPRVLQTAGGSDRPDWPAMESAIRQLATNYALGTDAIGRDEPEVGRALYHQTFTPDADISIAGQPGHAADGSGRVGWVRGGDVPRSMGHVGHAAPDRERSTSCRARTAKSAEMSTYMHATHLQSERATC